MIICVPLLDHTAVPSGCTVWDVGLKPLGCWDHGFISHWGHGCLACVFVVCCVGRGLCSKLVTHLEKSYRTCVCVCVCVCVWYRNLNIEAAYAQVELLQHKKKKKVGAHLQNVRVPGSLMARSTQHMTTAHETSNKSNVNWRYKGYCNWMCVCDVTGVGSRRGHSTQSHRSPFQLHVLHRSAASQVWRAYRTTSW